MRSIVDADQQAQHRRPHVDAIRLHARQQVRDPIPADAAVDKLEAVARTRGRQVGGNQQQTLPLRGFYKKSYPLPRDIAARTMIKIGRPALPLLAQVVRQGERGRALEAIDGVGHISFYTHGPGCEGVLMSAYEKYAADEVMQWKIVRAFQAFAGAGVQRLLAAVICSHDCAALRWEAARSLGQLGVSVPAEVLDCALQDHDGEVRHMARLFLSDRK